MKILETLNRLTVGRTILIGILLAAFYYIAIFDPGVVQTNSINMSNGRLREIRDKLDESQKKLDRANVYRATAARLGGTIQKFLSLIPEKFRISDLMRIVSNEAKVAGSSLATMSPKGTEVSVVAPEFEELTVSVELTGSFLQHMLFLSNLTKVNSILIVRSFDFTHVRDGNGEEPAVVKMVADIVAFRYRGNDKTGKSAEKK